MPRQARIDLPGYFYHVMVRGVERRAIFRSDVDRQDFLNRLDDGLVKTGSHCLTWALMSTHFHLLILSGVQGLAALMHPLLTGYVGGFNRRHRRVGHLVQNRFKALLCEEDSYLLELIRYIPLNPVRAGLVRSPDALARYPWTGHAALLGNAIVPWQSVDEVLGRFGTKRLQARRAYSDFVMDRWDQGKREDLEGGHAQGVKKCQAFNSQILGSGTFAEKILREAEKLEEQRATLSRSGLTLESLQALAAKATGVKSAALQTKDRSKRVSEARTLFIYAATNGLAQRSIEMARRLGMSSSSISEARQRGRKLAEKYRFLPTLKLSN